MVGMRQTDGRTESWTGCAGNAAFLRMATHQEHCTGQLFNFGSVDDANDDDCVQQVPSVALRR